MAGVTENHCKLQIRDVVTFLQAEGARFFAGY
jgi:hypothetical protein